MANKRVTAKNVGKVLDNIKAQTASDDWYRDLYVNALNQMLDDLNGDDAFGTEGQNDPRGDQRG